MTQPCNLSAKMAGGLTIGGCATAFILSSAAPLLISVAIKIAAIAMIAIAVYSLIEMAQSDQASAEEFFKNCKKNIFNLPDMICRLPAYIKICREKCRSAYHQNQVQNSNDPSVVISSSIEVLKSESKAAWYKIWK